MKIPARKDDPMITILIIILILMLIGSFSELAPQPQLGLLPERQGLGLILLIIVVLLLLRVI